MGRKQRQKIDRNSETKIGIGGFAHRQNQLREDICRETEAVVRYEWLRGTRRGRG